MILYLLAVWCSSIIMSRCSFVSMVITNILAKIPAYLKDGGLSSETSSNTLITFRTCKEIKHSTWIKSSSLLSHPLKQEKELIQAVNKDP